MSMQIHNLSPEDVYKIIELYHRHQSQLRLGYDMRAPLDCTAECAWDSRVYGKRCPQGGCTGIKITPNETERP